MFYEKYPESFPFGPKPFSEDHFVEAVRKQGNKAVLYYKNLALEKEINTLTNTGQPPISPVTINTLKEHVDWLCGYVVIDNQLLHPVLIEQGLSAPGINYLAIHGNLSYCSRFHEDGVLTDRWASECRAEMEALMASDDPDKRQKVEDIQESYRALLLTQPHRYTVFGFDTNHAGDKRYPELSKEGFVMRLVCQMEQQILALSAVYEDFLSGGDEVRKILIKNIIDSADIPDTEIGLNGLLKRMSDEW